MPVRVVPSGDSSPPTDSDRLAESSRHDVPPRAKWHVLTRHFVPSGWSWRFGGAPWHNRLWVTR
jgi:hypothetical protein